MILLPDRRPKHRTDPDRYLREAQFEVTSRMRTEFRPVDDFSFTPGTPFLLKLKMAIFF